MGDMPMDSEPMDDTSVDSEPKGDAPFDKTPFDAGVEADEDEDPKKFIEQLTGKLGTTLRSYTKKEGSPDFDLEKYIINSVISATHTAEMDEEDRKDIIKKINDAGEDAEPSNEDKPEDDVSNDNLSDDSEPKDDNKDEVNEDVEDENNKYSYFKDSSNLVKFLRDKIFPLLTDDEIDTYISYLTDSFDIKNRLSENDKYFENDSRFAYEESKSVWEANDLLGEGGDEGNNPTRYMFFSNLEQIRRQAGLLLDLDEGQIEAILNSGHDWAADHIATAKESFDQVFDFLMNETNDDEGYDEEDYDYSEWSKPMELKQDIQISEGLKYHLDNKLALGESVFRYGSDKFFELIKEVKNLYGKDLINLNENDTFIVNDFDATVKINGELYQLGYIMESEEEVKLTNNQFYKKNLTDDEFTKIHNFLVEKNYSPRALENSEEDVKIHNFLVEKNYSPRALKNMNRNEILSKVKEELEELDSLTEPQSKPINEAKYQGKEVELGKPKRGGSKKFYVYVKNPKTGKVKKVSFGAKSGGGKLAVKLKDPKARKAFADRHNCEQKNDKTKAGYWACRLPSYSRLLGLSGGSGKWW